MQGQKDSRRHREKAGGVPLLSLAHLLLIVGSVWKPPGLVAVRKTSVEMRGAYARRQ